MSEQESAAGRFSGRTAWARSLETPLRTFLRTESGSAAFLLAATVLALLWVNVDASSYARVWHTQLTIRVGGSGVSLDLVQWVNAGLMTFFFFVVGLEARREFDLGELRERRRGGRTPPARRRRSSSTSPGTATSTWPPTTTTSPASSSTSRSTRTRSSVRCTRSKACRLPRKSGRFAAAGTLGPGR